MADLDPEVMKAVPGAVGSAVSMLLIKDPWPRRIAMFFAGAAFGYWGLPWASKFTGLDSGFAGFLLGLFGMAAVVKLFETWEKFELTALFSEWLRKLLGLPAKEN
jgi:hypothetical protein